MLHAVFHYQGSDFRGNRCPESFDHLMEAAHSIAKQGRSLE